MKLQKIKRGIRRMCLTLADAVDPSHHASGLSGLEVGHDRETEVLWSVVRSRTMTSIDRIDALRRSIEHIQENRIPGDIVECGVWRGGSMMAAALSLNKHTAKRVLWLYDTFSGMPSPGIVDKDFAGRAASCRLAQESPETGWTWAKSSLDDVKAGMQETGYPPELIRYVEGPVEETIPQWIPSQIALLRLDTDWFASTRHELEHLWPRLSDGGILIIDDYGYWAGAKQAVDQFFGRIVPRPFMHRIDDTGRLIVKPHHAQPASINSDAAA